MSSGLTSTSLDRAPAPSTNFVRGKAGFVPFWPGGLDEAIKDSVVIRDLDEDSKGLKRVYKRLEGGRKEDSTQGRTNTAVIATPHNEHVSSVPRACLMRTVSVSQRSHELLLA